MLNWIKFFVLTPTFLFVSFGFGQSIWTNPITGTDPGLTNPYTTGDAADANISVSGIGRGTGIAGNIGDNRYNARGWDTGSIDLTGGYFEWTLTPDTGCEIDFTSFVYTSERSNNSIDNFALRSSVDGFVADIGTPVFNGTTINLSAGAYQNINSAITFRFYAWGAGASGNTFSINSFTFNGTTSCAPPSTNTITASNLSTTSFTIDCTTNDAGTIDLTSTGTFVAGNDYDIQLSDAAGNFSSPIIIGTVASTSNSENNIVITIPAGTTSSANYAIRIVSTNPAVISNILSPITITLTGGPCVEGLYNCTTVIWQENFESYADGVYSNVQSGALLAANNNTANPSADWTCHGNNCDSDGDLGTSGGNFFGISTNANGNKEFRVNDIEGLTCCGSSGQGQNDNYWITEEIDISSYSSISIAISARVEGNVECTTCGTGRDEFNASYSTDGGITWSAPFFTICGATSGFTDLNCIDVTGSTLRIRVLLGNQANDENYFFDNVIVCEASCNTLLPVELLSFQGEYQAHNSANSISWTSESESNNERYILLHSTNGKVFQSIGEVHGAGNSSIPTEYSFKHRTPHPGINYYKLKSVDYDGTVHDKGIIAVQVEMNHVFYDQITQSIQMNYSSDYAVYGSDGRLITRVANQNAIPFSGHGVFHVIDERSGKAFKLGVW